MSTYSRHNPAISPTKSPFRKLTPEDYPGIFGDFDKDGIANVDDPNPLVAGDEEQVEEVSMKK
jgi:hypothetical protein